MDLVSGCSSHAVATALFPSRRRRGVVVSPRRRLGEERLHRLGVKRARRDHDRGLCGIDPWSYSSSIDLNFRTDRDVEAREPDLRADEVDVQRVGQRVDEAADEEECRELGEERCREFLLDGEVRELLDVVVGQSSAEDGVFGV